jgi:3',5'-cyclic AMP phosphodiesterase CpdA
LRTIAHLSDLHFGTEDSTIAEALAGEIARLAPSLVVVSGDLTQRARRGQFERARRFLERLAYPRIVVPGNHDVPLFDVVRRFLQPLRRFRRFIDPEPYPFHCDDEMAVLGINTARSWTWKQGSISYDQMRRMDALLAKVPEGAFKVVVTHHPFLAPGSGTMAGVAPVGGARLALEILDRRGVDLLLAGHIHQGYSGDVRTLYPGTRRTIIAAQAGTAISHRRRNEPNAYNYITIREESMEVAVRMWGGDAFVPTTTTTYRRSEGRSETSAGLP